MHFRLNVYICIISISMDESIERVQEAYRSLKQLHVKSNDVNQDLLVTIDVLKKENEYLKTQLINLENNLNIQKTIVLNTIMSSQEKHDRDYQEIIELKNEINLLKGR